MKASAKKTPEVKLCQHLYKCLSLLSELEISPKIFSPNESICLICKKKIPEIELKFFHTPGIPGSKYGKTKWNSSYYYTDIKTAAIFIIHNQILFPGDVMMDGQIFNPFEKSMHRKKIVEPQDRVLVTKKHLFTLKENDVCIILNQKPESCEENEHSLEYITERRGAIYFVGLRIQAKIFEKCEVKLTSKSFITNVEFPAYCEKTTCPYSKKCLNFFKSFKYPERIFDYRGYRCYCEKCFYWEFDDMDIAGESYVIPKGWVRFGLRCNHMMVTVNNIWEKWSNAFHGTDHKAALSVIKHQTLLHLGDELQDGNKIKMKASKKTKDQWFVTPLIEYAAHPWYSKIEEMEMSSGEIIYAQIVLAMKIRKQSYFKQSETEGGAKKDYDNYKVIKENEVEWMSNRRGCSYPYGLLIRVFDEERKREIEMADYGPKKKEFKSGIVKDEECEIE